MPEPKRRHAVSPAHHPHAPHCQTYIIPKPPQPTRHQRQTTSKPAYSARFQVNPINSSPRSPTIYSARVYPRPPPPSPRHSKHHSTSRHRSRSRSRSRYSQSHRRRKQDIPEETAVYEVHCSTSQRSRRRRSDDADETLVYEVYIRDVDPKQEALESRRRDQGRCRCGVVCQCSATRVPSKTSISTKTSMPTKTTAAALESVAESVRADFKRNMGVAWERMRGLKVSDEDEDKANLKKKVRFGGVEVRIVDRPEDEEDDKSDRKNVVDAETEEWRRMGKHDADRL
ncbi:hypothetical protein BU24DRAFT_461703 [Aaosphaeria arxii CBS 175.79]|uniref:Uncharacterized protein n=1 Tax=Aaosphaeria arxii CBS 175.79 TaxID=1450172 RepID=A0A6A5XRJ4_9PLEO|nr:uncharacterized protein BU24DRAFT_461703 [Aaosphaeria arxii CBS 175.79]KAF2015457.1 hypothetical protein BU24DRAFT_461703 [Aaosphaeria arxii CBS 175.79]